MKNYRSDYDYGGGSVEVGVDIGANDIDDDDDQVVDGEEDVNHHHYHRRPQQISSAATTTTSTTTANEDQVDIAWHTLMQRKRKRMSDSRIVAVSATAIAAISVVVAFFSEYWLASERRLYGAKFVRLGLWVTCFRSFVSPEDYEMIKYYAGCRWIFAEEYQNIKHILMPGFFIATQVFYTIGFLFLLIACICVLAIQLCFIIEKEIQAMKLLSTVMFLSALFTTIAVIIFGIRGDDRDWMPDHEHNFLSWSFGFAVVGVFFSWIASILFWAESRILLKKELKNKRKDIYGVNVENNSPVKHQHQHQQQQQQQLQNVHYQH